MNSKEIDILFNDFLKQDRIFEPQLKSFESKITALTGANKEFKEYTNLLFKSIKKEFKNGVFTGAKSVNELKDSSLPKTDNIFKSKIAERQSQNKKKTISGSKYIKEKKKYIVPASKNKINENDAILLKLRIEYIRNPHTVSELAAVLKYRPSKLIELIKNCGFEEINSNTVVKMEHIIPLAEQIYDQRKKILDFETEIISKTTKTKPNFFRVIYNSPGSKR